MAETSNDIPGAVDTSVDTTPEPASLRDDLDAAFAQHDSEAPAPPDDKGGQPRDEAGRFAAKAPAAPAPAQPAVQTPPPQPRTAQGAPAQVPAAQATPAAPGLKAPVTWKPEVREKWAALPADVQAEVHRREGEVNKAFQTAAQYRQFAEAFESIVRPYEMFIRAENSNPLQAVQNLMATAAELRVGTPYNKANLICTLIGQYGVDVQMVDKILAQQRDQGIGWANPAAGFGQAQGQQQQGQYRDPRVDMLINELAAARQMSDQNFQASANQEVEAFAQAHEFYGDVSPVMASMIESEAAQGRSLELQQAYDIACQLNPEVRKILETRQQGSNAAQQTQAAIRARRAAASVKSEGVAHGPAQPRNDSLRAAIETAWDSAGDTRV